MAKLTFISETGMFHSAARCTFGGMVEWYGFKPKAHLAPAGEGYVDRSDRTSQINHALTFDVDDGVLRAAIIKAVGKYTGKTYVVSMVDCVSFTADLARNAGLKVPMVNVIPYRFLQELAQNNKYESWT